MLELFDYWDRTVQTGNDGEYTAVLLCLCIGAVIAIARFLAFAREFRFVLLDGAASYENGTTHPALLFAPSSAASPPALALRV